IIIFSCTLFLIISIVSLLILKNINNYNDIIDTLPLSNEDKDEGINFDISYIDIGKIGLNYSSDDKLKVIIEKNLKKYTYDLRNDGVNEYYPLQMGDGIYSVKLFRNIEGDFYNELLSKDVALELLWSNIVYQNSIQEINWNDKSYVVTMADELTEGVEDEFDKIKKIYNYIVENLKYDDYKIADIKPGYIPDNDKILNEKKGICYDFASLYASMLRSQGIPAKLVKGYADGIYNYHAWNEVYIKKLNIWIIQDLTYDIQVRELGIKYCIMKNPAKYHKMKEY
ncbi:MAG: transglutaminase-like domain-containing protein, partial [Clostridiales bacterium]